MTETKLKPCPFCGGKNIYKGIIYVPFQAQMFKCYKCGAEVCFGAKHEPFATEAWNRRSDNA